ncbi:MAG: hypothetical protein IPK15_23970 [Verrucomicrobia bacterium]|nr:hypothetical protein [Verrucomicrobiota bacterium]
MLRLIKRRLAIRSYVWKLSQELSRRFGKMKFYSVNQVMQAAERGHFSMAFIAYAHAIFCARGDFDAHYSTLGVNCTYDGLRAVVSRRYFGGVADFDAARVIAATRREGVIGEFEESGEGTHAS